MEIIYLKKLKASSSIGGRVIQGIQKNEINTIEKKLKIKFPKAYKEFIFLAGKYSGGLPLMDTSDIYDLSADWHKEIQQKELARTGISKQLQKPYWLFAESNACEVFYFFYLNDQIDNPEVFLVDYDSNDSRKIVPLNMNFSEFIEHKIEVGKNLEKYR